MSLSLSFPFPRSIDLYTKKKCFGDLCMEVWVVHGVELVVIVCASHSLSLSLYRSASAVSLVHFSPPPPLTSTNEPSQDSLSLCVLQQLHTERKRD